ncbi:hypothetical protein F5Y17DRAFT_435706 [Xylariaceae sp. FL0594]|nr:hypothetical protein F5Y17DRAFT_435706 [Xylariaceae sp. FL0594]
MMSEIARRHSAPAAVDTRAPARRAQSEAGAVGNGNAREAASDGVDAITTTTSTTTAKDTECVKETADGKESQKEGEMLKECQQPADVFHDTRNSSSPVRSPFYNNDKKGSSSARKPSTASRPSLDAFFRTLLMQDVNSKKQKRSSGNSNGTTNINNQNNNNNQNQNNNNNKRSSALTTESSTSTTSSVYSSIFNFDERRFSGLSDRMKMALKGSSSASVGSGNRGSRGLDPLEQWMVKHSGGTLRDAHVSAPIPANRASARARDSASGSSAAAARVSVGED